jgi:hypothetical protein
MGMLYPISFMADILSNLPHRKSGPKKGHCRDRTNHHSNLENKDSIR